MPCLNNNTDIVTTVKEIAEQLTAELGKLRCTHAVVGSIVKDVPMAWCINDMLTELAMFCVLQRSSIRSCRMRYGRGTALKQVRLHS